MRVHGTHGGPTTKAPASKWRIWVDRPVPAEMALPDDAELVDDPTEADGAVVGADEPWGAAACARLPRLKVVARSGIGYDNVDVAACAAAGVAACNTPDAPTVSTAEHALALLLAASKRLKTSERALRERRGDYRAAHRALELRGRTLGLLGCGRIGTRMARYASALGMEPLVCDPHAGPAHVASLGARLVSLDELWRRSDALSLHAPATHETRHVISAGSIAAMRSGVIIVNCARGSLIDHQALLAGLVSGQVGAAGLDVTDPEPLPEGHPLLERDDVIITPHVASSTTVGAVRLLSQAMDQALAWLRGGTPEHLLDRAAAAPAVDRRVAQARAPNGGAR